ncbi:dipeptidyl aminopeptidase/acylaminoacyl peptidase [Arthrobacter pascens]|uniref:S9 family peptidase n=1 Tax=Arthrobacter pascens TaxID=1677 RepID=UPI00279025B6|nr:S9 family peptidase [Arthrobacter pascens]MDQ0678344.1 dipeptidyl aminopeptidase/acylaminoacyl peptidase [Arthrobacter pascens]
MKPEHLPLLNSVSAPAVHPDGSRAVVSVTRPDFLADSYVGQLWNVPLDPLKLPRRMTRGFLDTAPSFSPDGLVLAFLRAAGPSAKPQLWVVEAEGGEPQQLTDRLLGVESFAWSPDSHRIVFSSREPAEGRYGSSEGVGREAEDPRFITTYQYRMNGVGYTKDKPTQLFVMDVPGLGDEPRITPRGRTQRSPHAADAPDEEPRYVDPLPPARQLTSLAADHHSAGFSSDGSYVYFVAAPPENDEELSAGIYRVPIGGGDPIPVRPADAARRAVQDVLQSKDGAWLFFIARGLGDSGRDFVARNAVLYCMPAEGGDAVALTDPEMMDVACPGGRIELRGADRALVLNNAQGTVELLELSATGDHALLVHGDKVATGAAWAGGSLLVAFCDPSTAGDLAVLEGGQLRLLTDFSAPLRTEAEVVVPQELTFDSGDGYPVHGWLVKPAGKGPHPVLLNIHGGPFAQYTGAFFDEAQVYADAGYAVLMCNPRGSAGYGREHGLAIKGRLGTVDMQDVLAFLDGALKELPALDAGRLGIMGGSYGGYLTAWTIARDHRFQGAIVERGFLDPVSFEGSADIGWYFGAEYTGGSRQEIAAQSPMEHVDDVRTPTLVIHSEDDLRCPIEQGQRYFTALKRRGVETALLVFPGEDHELSRSGTPHHRRQRFEHILRWWSRFLPTAANQEEPPSA